jgi:hypothetical protein
MITEYVDTKYNQLDVNKQSFENIEQIIDYLKYPMSFDLNYLLVALENTKKNGYELHKNVIVPDNTNHNVDNGIKTILSAIKRKYDKNTFNPVNIGSCCCVIDASHNTCGNIHNEVIVRDPYTSYCAQNY